VPTVAPVNYMTVPLPVPPVLQCALPIGLQRVFVFVVRKPCHHRNRRAPFKKKEMMTP